MLHCSSATATGARCMPGEAHYRYAKPMSDPTKKLWSCVPRSLAACEVAGFAHVPLFICGCSLGGCIVVNAIHQQPELFRGTILLAPMLSLEKASRHGLNPYLRCRPVWAATLSNVSWRVAVAVHCHKGVCA